jgi:two-component system response regulator FixJ
MVFVVDDDPATLEALESLVDVIGVPARCYESAESMLSDYNGQQGCAMVELRLPGMTGLELMDRLAAQRAPLGVVMISAHGDVPAAVQAMKNGAVDFLQKPCAPELLRECVTRALQAGAARGEAVETNGSPELDRLSESERAVLDLTVAGTPNRAIASQLSMSLRTVHIRRASLMRKLGAKNRAELIRLVVQRELRSRGDGMPDLCLSIGHARIDEPQGAFRHRAPDR